jgi:hypothetical protein
MPAGREVRGGRGQRRWAGPLLRAAAAHSRAGGIASVPGFAPRPLAAPARALASAPGPLAAEPGPLATLPSTLGVAPCPLRESPSLLAQAASRRSRWSPAVYAAMEIFRMGTWYIPQREGGFDAWAGNFASLIALDPAAYGVAAPDAAALSSAYALWHAAYATARAPGTRTRPAVSAKNDAKAALLTIVKRLAAAVRANPAVEPGMRVALGLRNPDGILTPIPAPEGAPTLAVVRIERGAHTLRTFTGGESGEALAGRARPRGAIGLMVFRAVGEETERDPARASFLALVTRGSFSSAFSPADRGKLATYFARWASARGELGPWSLPAVAPVAA